MHLTAGAILIVEWLAGGPTDGMDVVPIGYIISVGLLAFCTATAVIGPRPAHTTQTTVDRWSGATGPTVDRRVG